MILGSTHAIILRDKVIFFSFFIIIIVSVQSLDGSCDYLESHCICYVVTRNIVCSLVRGDNPQALASGLSPVHVDNHGITILPPTSV